MSNRILRTFGCTVPHTGLSSLEMHGNKPLRSHGDSTGQMFAVQETHLLGMLT